MTTVWEEQNLEPIQHLAEKWGKDDALMGDAWGFTDVVLANHLCAMFPPESSEKVIAVFEEMGSECFYGVFLAPLIEQLINVVEHESGLTSII